LEYGKEKRRKTFPVGENKTAETRRREREGKIERRRDRGKGVERESTTAVLNRLSQKEI
jgi:hypothetical protein